MANHAHFMMIGLLAGGCVDDVHADGTAASVESRRLPGTGGVMPPPADPEQAIRSEYAAAEQKDTADAYALFAARHPGHRLAQEAARRAAARTPKASHDSHSAPCPGGDRRNCDEPF